MAFCSRVALKAVRAGAFAPARSMASAKVRRRGPTASSRDDAQSHTRQPPPAPRVPPLPLPPAGALPRHQQDQGESLRPGSSTAHTATLCAAPPPRSPRTAPSRTGGTPLTPTSFPLQYDGPNSMVSLCTVCRAAVRAPCRGGANAAGVGGADATESPPATFASPPSSAPTAEPPRLQALQREGGCARAREYAQRRAGRDERRSAHCVVVCGALGRARARGLNLRTPALPPSPPFADHGGLVPLLSVLLAHVSRPGV